MFHCLDFGFLCLFDGSCDSYIDMRLTLASSSKIMQIRLFYVLYSMQNIAIGRERLPTNSAHISHHFNSESTAVEFKLQVTGTSVHYAGRHTLR